MSTASPPRSQRRWGYGECSVTGLARLDRQSDPAAFDLEADRFCRDHGLDYRFTPEFCGYWRAYSGAVERDASFLLRDGDTTVGLAFVPLERRNGELGVTIAGSAILAPATLNEEAERAAFARLDEIALEAGAARVALNASPASHRWDWNRLRIYGFVDCSALDVVVDLKLDDAALWSSLRKSYKALINKYSDRNGCETLVVDAAAPDRELHETYRALHAKAAGRVTRDKVTFDLQYEMLLQGNATLLALRCADGIAGCAYFGHNGAAVDYFSMADDPDMAPLRLPISHVLLWAAVRHFKARGFAMLRLSQPAGFSAVEGFGDYASPKELTIAHFKHGIGTRIIPAFRGVRYYDDAAFERDVEQFRTAYRQARGAISDESA